MTAPRWVLPAVLWLLVVVAPLPLPGAGTSLGLHVVVLFGLALWLKSAGRASRVGLALLLCLALLLTLHTFTALLISPCRDMQLRSVLSLVLLVGVLASLAIAAAASRERVDLGRTLTALILVIDASVVLDSLWLWLSHASPFLRPSGLFSEPSHLALSCAPVLAALGTSGMKRERWLGWLSAGLLAWLSASATFFILFGVCALGALLSAGSGQGGSRQALRLLLGLGAAVTLVVASPYRDDFLARLQGVGADASVESNVSSLIYLNGWQTMLSNLESTDGMGLGLNRMGCAPRPMTDVSDILEGFDLGDFNYNDGSFTAAKLLSELGVFGAVLLLVFGWHLLRLVRAARAESNPARRQALILGVGCLLVVTVGAFIRGTGYFSGPFLMGVFVLFWLRRQPSGT